MSDKYSDKYLVWNPLGDNPQKTFNTFSDALGDAKERTEHLPPKVKLYIFKCLGVVHNPGLIFEPIDKYVESGILVEEKP